MKRILFSVVALAMLSIAATPIYANDAHPPKVEAQKNYIAKGEVVAIDKAAGKVKLKHEAIPELDWPAMTMFFPVAEKAQLDAVKFGDHVKFQFVNANGSGPLITHIGSVK